MIEPRSLSEFVLADRWRFIAVIGAGSDGTVYLAADERSGEAVAIKVYDSLAGRDAASIAEGMANETSLRARFDSPYLVRNIHYGVARGQGGLDAGFVVMEHLDGYTLRSHLEGRGGTLPLDEALALMLELAIAIGSLHDHRVVHLDLKPENVFVLSSAASRRGGVPIKVLDLGAARHLDQPLAPVQGRGTPTYVAPEVCERLPSVDTQADVYSLGILLYELLVGTPPLQPGTPAQLVAQHVYARLAPLPPSMNWGELATIYETATARDPERRYRGARELASAIDLFRNRRLREASRPAALTPGGIEPGQPSLLDTLLARTPRTDERSQPRLRLPSGGYGAPSRPSDPPPPAPTWPRPGEGSESE